MNLTERRKAATELEIARAAASLFAERGSGGTTVEAIADRAGLSLRTFYRYFPTKQDAVAPLLSTGAQRWLDLLAATPPEDILRARVRVPDTMKVALAARAAGGQLLGHVASARSPRPRKVLA